MKNEFEEEEQRAFWKWTKATSELTEITSQILAINECLDYPLIQETKPFLSWLDRLEAIENEGITATIKIGQLRDKAASPNRLVGPQDISMLMNSMKLYLQEVLSQLIRKGDALEKRVPELEDIAHGRKVDRLTLEYGKDSVDLTKRNIKISLWVPVLTFLLGTVVFEIFKPEIVNGIRQILGLARIP